jgi:hypothetical protein
LNVERPLVSWLVLPASRLDGGVVESTRSIAPVKFGV